MTGPRLMGLDEGTQSTDPIYISENKLYVATYVWDSGSLAWVKATQASGGGGSVTVTNFPASQTVDDGGLSITVDGPLTDAELRATPVPVSGTISATPTKSTTPAQTSPSVTIASTSVLASNAARLGATIYNEGPQVCYLKLGATASTTSYSVQLVVGAYYEVPFAYTGAIDGITSTSTAQLRVTELT